jgi:hypothetical protein
MLHLTAQQALQLAADFVHTVDYMRATDAPYCQTRAKLLETASRAAFLRAHAIARQEEARPVFGEGFRRAVFAVA